MSINNKHASCFRDEPCATDEPQTCHAVQAVETPLNLDDISRCPRRSFCEVCAAEPELINDVFVATAETTLGVLCITLCDYCADMGHTPAFDVPTTADRTAAHCGHLGIDLDQMAAARKRAKELELPERLADASRTGRLRS